MRLAKARQTGNKLKVYRVKRKMTAADLAEKAGLDRASISNIENNNRRPRPETVLKLAFALGFDVESAEEAAEILGIQMSKSRVAQVAQAQEEQEQEDLTSDVANPPGETLAEGIDQPQESQEQENLVEAI